MTDLPATLESLEKGRISLTHARVIVDAGRRIDEPELRAEYQNSVLSYAEAESASRLRPIARRRAQWFLDETIQVRHAAAAAHRAVRVIDLDDGMSELRAPLPSVLAQGILDRLTRMGREVADAEAQTIRDAKVTAREAERDADRLATLIEVHGADADLPMSTDAELACRARADEARERARTARTHADHLVATRRSLDEIRADILADLLLASDPQGHVGRTKTRIRSPARCSRSIDTSRARRCVVISPCEISTAVFPDAGSPPLGVMSTIRSTTPSAGRPSTRIWRTSADDITC